MFLATEFPPQPGGIGNHALHLAKGLEENGYSVKLICDQRSGAGVEEAAFDQTLPFEVLRIQRKKPIFRSYLNRIRVALKAAKQSETVIASGKFSLWLGAFLKWRYPKKKFIAVIHGSEVLLENALLRKFTDRCLKSFDHVIAVSNFTASLVSHLQLKSITVIPNGFELNPINGLQPQKTETPALITVGNVTERKGQQNIIAALPVLLKRFPDLKYHIVGIPTEQQKLMALAKKLGVETAIHFHGKVSEVRKQELLSASDVFVMLSENTKSGDVEGFGIAILEGNVLGLPAIGALGCGIEDAIKDGYSGRLIDNKDHEGFVKALEEIMGDYELYSQNAKEWAENFRWEEIIKRYVGVLSLERKNHRDTKSTEKI